MHIKSLTIATTILLCGCNNPFETINQKIHRKFIEGVEMGYDITSASSSSILLDVNGNYATYCDIITTSELSGKEIALIQRKISEEIRRPVLSMRQIYLNKQEEPTIISDEGDAFAFTLKPTPTPLQVANKIQPTTLLIIEKKLLREEDREIISKLKASFSQKFLAEEADREREKLAKENERKNAINNAKKKSIIEIESDQPSYINTPILITGSIKISSYYNYGFRNLKNHYLSFSISDATGTANLYADRYEIGPKLREKILNSSSKKITASLVIEIEESTYDKNSREIFAIIKKIQASDE